MVSNKKKKTNKRHINSFAISTLFSLPIILSKAHAKSLKKIDNCIGRKEIALRKLNPFWWFHYSVIYVVWRGEAVCLVVTRR